MDKFYLVFRADVETPPSHANGQPAGFIDHPGAFAPYNPVTTVAADDAEDAVKQVANALGRFGSYVAVECKPVSISLTPRRLEITD